jgi:phosphatidate phosphatase APP1
MHRKLKLPALLLLLGALGGCKRDSGPAKAWLELYGGFAAPAGGFLLGRVHAGEPPVAPVEGESKMRRVAQTIESLEANPVAGARVSVTVAGRPFEVVTGDRGYIAIDTLPGYTPPPTPPATLPVHLQLGESAYRAAPVDGEVAVYDDLPGLAVISDIDDTLLDSEVTHKARLAENTLTRSTYELKAFAGAAPVLTKLAGAVPIFFVSGSPWGFHDRLGGYFARNGFPKATLVLKRLSAEPLTDQMAFKWPHVLQVVDALPRRRFLCFGDSGEKDPEVYDRLRRERPGRVEAIYIHLVTPEDPAASRFQGMRVFKEWDELNR